MAEKTTEQLIEEIMLLKKQLKEDKAFVEAGKAVLEWAESLGYKYSNRKRTAEDYIVMLDKILGDKIFELTEEIEGLKENLKQEQKYADQLLEAKHNNDEDAYVFTSEIQEKNESLKSTLAALDKKVADLEELSKHLEKAEDLKKRAMKAALNYKHEVRDLKKEVASLSKELADWQKKYEAKEAELAAYMAKQDKVRAHIIAGAGEYKKKYEAERMAVSDEKSRARKLSSENEALKAENVKFQEIATHNLYAEVVAMIVDTFNSHIAEDKKKIPAYAYNATNAQTKNRQVALWKAIAAAKKADKKAEKLVKGTKEEPIYSDSGYTKVVAEIVEKYKAIAEKYDSKSLYNFKNAFSSEEDRKDGVVTDEEIIKTILETEPQKPFLKTKKGIVLVAVSAVLAVVTIGTIVALLIPREGNQATPVDTDTDVEQDKLPVDVVLNVNDADAEADFIELQDQLASQRGGALLDLDYCQYNRQTGEVTIQFEIMSSRGIKGIETVTFKMDMKNMSNEVVEGSTALDFAAIARQMLEAEENGELVRIPTYNTNASTNTSTNTPAENDTTTENDSEQIIDSGNNTFADQEQDVTVEDNIEEPVQTPDAPLVPSTGVNYSMVTKADGSFDIVCKVVVTEIVDGQRVVNTYISDPYEFRAGYDVTKAEDLVRADFFEQIGIAEEEIVLE